MKKLVVYYSFEGNTRLISTAIANEIGADIVELKPIKETVQSQWFWKYFWWGKQVIFKEKPELEKNDLNPQDYDIIFIGTPVWAWTYTPAIRTFLEAQNLKEKHIAVFCTHQWWMWKTLESMKSKLNENKIIWEKDFPHVKKQEKESCSQATQWAVYVVNSLKN